MKVETRIRSWKVQEWGSKIVLQNPNFLLDGWEVKLKEINHVVATVSSNVACS